MKNPKLILQILNLGNALLLSIYLLKIMGWSTIFNPVKLLHLIIGGFAIYGLKSWIEVKTNTKDPIRTNKTVFFVFSIGSAMFIIGLAFKIMHWPMASVLLILGVAIACFSFILSFFVPETEDKTNSDILDDINYD